MMKRTMLALTGALSLVATCALADVKSEIVTAATHADLAAKAATIDAVHMHLHHAVNCLVGPSGKGFDAKQINPCAHNGNGAIPDTADAAKKAKLQAAADKAESGIAATNLATAQKAATDTAAMLKTDE
ncbi:MAG: hypothetical protein JSR81_09025 [Proteobacteria bacterium]|jgi:hypothetical protein|nr:hypothetical protein [Pseudomonadota bacterium]